MQSAIFGIVVAGTIIYAANMQQIHQTSGRIVNTLLLIVSALGILLGGYIALIALVQPMAAETAMSAEQAEILAQLPNVSSVAALFFMVLSFVLGTISIIVIVSREARLWIARVVIRGDDKNRHYNPDSIVHTTAIVLAIFEILNVVGGFVLAGGIEGIASELAETLSFEMLFSGLLTYLLVALLGVGLFIRRDGQQTLQRLALNSIHPRQLLIGAAMGFVAFCIVYGLEIAWSMVVSPEKFAEQSAAAEQLFLAFSGSLVAGLLLALTSAIGEEILFRGALQPIFGMFWTSIFFALLHTQYTLTPASLLIFGVSLVFGWLRMRYNTTASIAAHFVYNFVPFILYWIGTQITVV